MFKEHHAEGILVDLNFIFLQMLSEETRMNSLPRRQASASLLSKVGQRPGRLAGCS